MANSDDQDSNVNEAEGSQGGNYIGSIIGVLLLPVLFFFTHIGRTDLGLSAFVVLGMNILAVGVCWDLRKRRWFWAVIFIVLAVQLALCLLVHWPHEWVPRMALLPVGLADLVFVVGIMRLIERLTKKVTPTDQED